MGASGIARGKTIRDDPRLHGKKTTTKFIIKTKKCFPARVPIPILEGLAPGRGRTTPAHRTAGSAAPLGVSPAPRLPEQQGRARSLRTEMEEATREGESSAGPWGTDWGKQRGDGATWQDWRSRESDSRDANTPPLYSRRVTE